MKGANVAGLLDIRLLELSGGKRGLREVIYDLSQTYGKDRYFMDAEFFDIFVEHSEPEIEDFLNRYVRRGEALPYKEYYGKLGINFYTEPKPAGTPDLGYGLNLNQKREVFVSGVGETVASMGLEKGDILMEVNSKKFTLQELNGIFQGIMSSGIGTEYSYKVKRGEEEKVISLKTVEAMQRFTFELNSSATPAQLKLRKAWLTNMKLN
jgi:predicted metalloprotease with PDZ domain